MVTETDLRLSNVILMSLDARRSSDLVLLDLSAAFDTVHHCVGEWVFIFWKSHRLVFFVSLR